MTRKVTVKKIIGVRGACRECGKPAAARLTDGAGNLNMPFRLCQACLGVYLERSGRVGVPITGDKEFISVENTVA